jgi:DNA-binding FrmR family transcriptional regulator
LKTIKSKKNNPPEAHPDHGEDLLRLRRIRGQLDGIEKMINERRYCPEIMNQLRSVAAAVKSVETLVMGRHLRHCVADAMRANDAKNSDAKIKEIVALFKRD